MYRNHLVLLSCVVVFTTCSIALSVAASIEVAAEGGAIHTPANILFFAPVGSKSHKNFYYGIIEALDRAGHKVTIITPYKPARKLKNVKEIVMESNDISSLIINSFTEGKHKQILNVVYSGPDMCIKTLGEDAVQAVFKQKFDLVFISMFFGECVLGHVHTMQAPFVFVNPAEMFGPLSGVRMGNPTFPSFDTNPILKLDNPVSFPSRLMKVVGDMALFTIFGYASGRMERIAREQNLVSPNTPPFDEIAANASLMVANSFRLSEHPRPYMPNILLLGGIHLKPPQPLPADLEQWVSSAGKAGIIFFSLGSAVRSSDIPDELVKTILSVFASLDQKVLWKYDLNEVAGGLPDNVRLTKWAPQQDLLGDKRTRLFITHGGLFSTQEATYHGVPVIGLPVFGDQEGNMNTAEVQGWGKKLAWEDLTYDVLRSAILGLINDPVKRARVKEIGQQMRESPSVPADDIIWWTDYILRTGGAKHLRSGAADLAWYQLYNIDVWLLLVSVVLLLLLLLLTVVNCVCRRCCCRQASKNKKTAKKQKRN